MVLVGIVLFFAMVIFAIYMYNEYYDNMLSNMRLVAYHSSYPTDFLSDNKAQISSPTEDTSSSALGKADFTNSATSANSGNTNPDSTPSTSASSNTASNDNSDDIVDIYAPDESGDTTSSAAGSANISSLPASSAVNTNTASGDATQNSNTASGDATEPDSEDIVSAIYSNNNDSVIISPSVAGSSTQSDSSSSNSDTAKSNTSDNEYLEQIVRTALNQEDAVGLLKQYNMYYYKSSDSASTKVELTNSSYITNNMSKLIIRLIFIYAFLMFIFYLISYLISRMAIVPLDHALNMQRQFVTDLSHDLKTPLTIILTNNSIIKSGTEDPSKWIESTDTAAHNMLDMVNEMMDLSELDAMTKLSKTEAADFSSIVYKASLQVESLCFEHNVDFETNIEDGLYVNGNEDYLLRIATSLMENALKYEPENGKISILLSSNKRRITLIVHNYTSVISPEDLPHIFERFYRADKARSNSSSHGLGLSIVQRMTQMMKGEVSASSSPDEGTLFKVVFPQASVDLSK